MFERSPAGIFVGVPVADGDGQHAQQVGARAHRHHVQRTGWTAGLDPDLAGAGGEQGRGQVESGRHPLDALPRTPDPEAPGRVERRPAPGQHAHRIQDGRDPGPVQRQPREALVDVVRNPDLGQLELEPALELAPLEEAGHLPRDRAQEIDVGRGEIALLDALHVEHADQPRAGLDRNREHGVEALLVEARDPLPVRLPAHLGDDHLAPGLGHPARDALADAHRDLADHLLVEPVGRRQQQVATVRLEQVEGADVGAHRRRGLPDDQLHQLARLLRGRRGLGQPLQEFELAHGQAEVGLPGLGHAG